MIGENLVTSRMRVIGQFLVVIAAWFSVSAARASQPPVTALAYRPGGTQIAFGVRGEVILKEIAGERTLARYAAGAGRVTAVAWSKDGAMLAIASGQPARSGEVRLYSVAPDASGSTSPSRTIAAHAELIQALVFSPDGKWLATCSYDRLIKIWETSTGNLLRTLKDHSDAVYGLAFRPDGKLLASVAADRSVKIWDPANGARLYSLGDSTDWVYAVAWSPDGKRLAAAGVDKSIRIWDISPAEGKLVLSAFAHEKPILKLAFSTDGTTLFSLGEDRVVKAWDATKLAEKKVYPAQAESVLSFDVRPDGKQFALGRYDGAAVLIDAKTGKMAGQPLPESPYGFDSRNEPPGTESPRTAPEIKLQSTIMGNLTRAGEVDYYRVALAAGDEVGVHVQSPTASKIEPVLSLEDADGNVLASSTGNALGYRAAKSIVCILSVRDREFRGGKEFDYRLHIGAIPVVTSYSPLGVQAGTMTTVTVRGVNLGGELHVPVHAPASGKVPVPLSSKLGEVLNAPSLVVGEFPQAALGQPLAVPGTGEGVIDQCGTTQTWSFHAKKGQPLIVETEARRLGSPLDSVIEILDSHDQPIPLAVLRCMAKTVTMLRDHDANGSGIRMESWNEFAVDDFVLVGSELMRIRELPRNPDDDCQFYSVNGRRVGYLGTTPNYHAQSSPMFRVAIHPPGSVFPPNGMPLVILNYRNDDGGSGYGKDSRLRFDPPADGEYRVRVGDARGMAGPDFAYRVTVRPPRPDFKIRFNPTAPAVWKGGAMPITVTADRIDDFDSRIAVRLDNLPPGFSAPPTFIEAGQTSTTFALYADSTATSPDKKLAPPTLVASAKIAGKDVTHEAMGGLPTAVDSGDIVTTSAQSIVSIRPGQETRLVVSIERRNGFKGRIPIEVQGLPHGVRVLHIGLNGILITERDTSREIVLYADPWVQPMEHPIVVLAKQEGKNTEHAARSVLLKVER